MLEQGDDTDYIPTVKEVNRARNRMESELRLYTEEKEHNARLFQTDQDGQKEIQCIKKQILDIGDRFDLLTYMLLKQNKIDPNAVAESKNTQEEQDLAKFTTFTDKAKDFDLDQRS